MCAPVAMVGVGEGARCDPGSLVPCRRGEHETLGKRQPDGTAPKYETADYYCERTFASRFAVLYKDVFD
jgi:hypothetical protein